MKKRELTFPTLVGLIVAVGGLVSGLWLVQGQLRKSSSASVEETPKNVKITNQSDSSFVVSWVTDLATTGYVQYGEGEDGLEMIVSDERDLEKGAVEKYFTHYVVLQGLKPETEYNFKIGSGKSTFDLEGIPYKVTTGPRISQPPAADVAYGQVVTASKDPADGAIVYMQLAEGTMQSALVKPSGSWVISLSAVRKVNLTENLTYDLENGQVSVLAEGGPMGNASVMTTTAKDSPVPDIILGSGTTTASPDTTAAAVPSEGELDVLAPNSGEFVNTSRPEIVGVAPAGTEVSIEIHSEAIIKGVSVADEQGKFSFSVPTDLPPGEHTITISAVIDGVVQKISKSFTVYAAGESSLPAFTATPSATLAPSPSATPKPTSGVIPQSPTATPRPSPTLNPTPTTKAPTPTAAATPKPTLAPTPTPATPVQTSSLPASGQTENSWVLGISGAMLIAVGWWWEKRMRRKKGFDY